MISYEYLCLYPTVTVFDYKQIMRGFVCPVALIIFNTLERFILLDGFCPTVLIT